MSERVYGAVTDTGRRREHNEDSHGLSPEAGLFVVSDGMGGHQAGEVASALAVETITKAVLEGQSLEEAISQAHQAILEAGRQNLGVRGMGATVVALRLTDIDYEIAWVGDSRAYLWDGSLSRLTRDHSLVQRLLDEGALTPEEARNHPNGSVITQALGALELADVKVDTVRGRLYAGQKLLLCSDGLTSELEDDEIAAYLGQGGQAQDMAERLVEAANQHGGRDNTTVIIVDAPSGAQARPGRGDTRPINTDALNDVIGQSKKARSKNAIIAAVLIIFFLLALAVGGWLWAQFAARPAPEPEEGGAPVSSVAPVKPSNQYFS